MKIMTNKRKQITYVVQPVADDLGIASVVVPTGHCVLQRPEQTVINLHTHIQANTLMYEQNVGIT